MGVEVEAVLRAHFLQFDFGSSAHVHVDGDALELVQQTAVFLELLLAGAVAHELTAGAAASGEAPSNAEDLVLRVEQRVGITLSSILRDAKKYLHLEIQKHSQSSWMPMATLTRRVRSILDACPIEEIEKAASVLSSEDWGHRVRIAYDGLRAFLFRTDQQCQEQLRIAGGAYSRGHISVEEVAKLLAIHPVDALALLDQAGFQRPIELIGLDSKVRSVILDQMRADRLHRAGRFEPSAERISRDVVASERIEGIDARRWIPREGS
jgi:hypothetical protein